MIVENLKQRPPEHAKITVNCIGCDGVETGVVFNLHKAGWMNFIKSIDRMKGRTHHAWCAKCAKAYSVAEE